MAKEMTIKQLIQHTYLKIIRQFLICLILFYIVPALLSSVSGINEKNANLFALFFSVSSWIYLCIICFNKFFNLQMVIFIFCEI